jgi:hypothetical protein
LPNTKVVDQITFSNFHKGRPIKNSTDLEIISVEVADFYVSVKLFSRALTEFLRAQTSKFEMLVIE